jgi:hypothetical protein
MNIVNCITLLVETTKNFAGNFVATNMDVIAQNIVIAKFSSQKIQPCRDSTNNRSVDIFKRLKVTFMKF